MEEEEEAIIIIKNKNDEKQQQQLVNVVREWKRRFTDPKTPHVLNLPVADVCSKDVRLNHKGKTKAVCQLHGYPAVALLIRYRGVSRERKRAFKAAAAGSGSGSGNGDGGHDSSSSSSTRNGSEWGIQVELQTLKKLQDLHLPVIPFVNEVLYFDCNNHHRHDGGRRLLSPSSYDHHHHHHHPYMGKSLKKQMKRHNNVCAGYVAAYIGGPHIRTVKIQEIFRALPSHLFTNSSSSSTSSSSSSSSASSSSSTPVVAVVASSRTLHHNPMIRSDVQYLKRLGSGFARDRFTNIIRRVSMVLQAAKITIEDFQGMLNVSTGEFLIMDAMEPFSNYPQFYLYLEAFVSWIEGGCLEA